MNFSRSFLHCLLIAMVVLTGFSGNGCQISIGSAPQNTGTSANIDPEKLFSVYFMPWDDGEEVCLKFLREPAPKKSVLVVSFTYNDEEMTDELVEIAESGVKVRVILDKRQYASVKTTAAMVKKMEAAGIEVAIGSSEAGDIIHEKFIVKDGVWVLKGSMNFTENGPDQNNHIEVNNYPLPGYAARYTETWNRMYNFIRYDKRYLPDDYKRHRKTHRKRRRH